MKSRKEANIEATKAALLAAARRQFARVGYSRAQTGRIAADARVTTGALYHHFGSKKKLFQAVAEQLEAEILAAATGGGQEEDPWGRFIAAFERLIDVCASADMQRIIFVEAPQVIGPEAWREVEFRYAFGVLHATLPRLIEHGVIKPFPIDLIARTLLAVLREASAELARAKQDPRARAQVFEFAAGLLSALAAR